MRTVVIVVFPIHRVEGSAVQGPINWIGNGDTGGPREWCIGGKRDGRRSKVRGDEEELQAVVIG